ncbi:MAG: DNA polymerase IV, partial [Ignavibacteriales bacterium]|nr:DNA polymerase IV [Ignavibacteriales bacterium]
GRPRHIAHLDLDCFFVSVERIDNPSLIGKPVAVGGTPSGRGVVASASYEARKFGVRSAMPAGQALRACPDLMLIPGHYRRYAEISDSLFKHLHQFAPIIERASIDEMYLDLTGTEALYKNDFQGLIQTIQRSVRSEFSLPCTIALASNKTIAKIATDQVKPEGLCVVPAGREKAFLAPLPISVIPGVGKKTEAYLRKKGFATVADFQKSRLERLTALLGKHGVWLYRVAQGGGSETVHREYIRKSIGKEETFPHDSADKVDLERKLRLLVGNVCDRLRRKRWRTRTVTLKLRYSDFHTITRSETIAATNDDPVVFATVRQLFRRGYTRKLPVRLLGVQLSHFLDPSMETPELFDEPTRRDDVLDAVGKLRDRFGEEVIHVGTD